MWTRAMHMPMKSVSVQTNLACYYLRLMALLESCSSILLEPRADCALRYRVLMMTAPAGACGLLTYGTKTSERLRRCLPTCWHALVTCSRTHTALDENILWWGRGAQNTNTQFSMCPLHVQYASRGPAIWQTADVSPCKLRKMITYVVEYQFLDTPCPKEQWIVFLDSCSLLNAWTIFLPWTQLSLLSEKKSSFNSTFFYRAWCR